MLAVVMAWLATKFSSLFTNVSAVFNVVLNELPDDAIGALHAGMTAASSALAAGQSAEDAFTAGLNAIEATAVSDGKAIIQQLLQGFVTATAPSAPTQAA